ncbi:MAG: hypothetical protein ACOZNI_20810 [Myxococcota bacterium]
MYLRPIVCVVVVHVGMSFLAACGTHRAAVALSDARTASKRACESARSSRSEATSNVQEADGALVAAQQALTAASVKGGRPKAAAKAALYDQADEAVRAATERLRLAKDQLESASRAEESACLGM